MTSLGLNLSNSTTSPPSLSSQFQKWQWTSSWSLFFLWHPSISPVDPSVCTSENFSSCSQGLCVGLTGLHMPHMTALTCDLGLLSGPPLKLSKCLWPFPPEDSENNSHPQPSLSLNAALSFSLGFTAWPPLLIEGVAAKPNVLLQLPCSLCLLALSSPMPPIQELALHFQGPPYLLPGIPHLSSASGSQIFFFSLTRASRHYLCADVQPLCWCATSLLMCILPAGVQPPSCCATSVPVCRQTPSSPSPCHCPRFAAIPAESSTGVLSWLPVMLADIVSLFSCFPPSVCFHLLYLALSLDRSLWEADCLFDCCARAAHGTAWPWCVSRAERHFNDKHTIK